MAIYLMVNGARVTQEIAEPGQIIFRLELPVSDIRLVTGHAILSDIGVGTDYRRLGVALRWLRWRQGETTIEHSVESSSFIDGFHLLEKYGDDDVPFRWTNGDAGLPPGIIPDWRGEAFLHLGLSQWEGTAIHAPPKPEAAMLSAFENLGENCELAVAQQHYGLQPPLTLLSWAGTTYDKLVQGLENRFLGLGDPETTEVAWVKTDYRLLTPYLSLHTSANRPKDDAALAEIHRTGCATLRLLRRRFLRDVSAARRIFVFKTADPSLGEAGMVRLHQSLPASGPASLLCVTPARPGSDSANPERLTAGLYAGQLEQSAIPDGPFDEWLALCARTLTLHYTS